MTAVLVGGLLSFDGLLNVPPLPMAVFREHALVTGLLLRLFLLGKWRAFLLRFGSFSFCLGQSTEVRFGCSSL